MTDLRISEEVALPAGFDSPRHAGRLPTSAGAHSNPADDLGLGRQGVGIEPGVGMRFRTLGSDRSAFPQRGTRDSASRSARTGAMGEER